MLSFANPAIQICDFCIVLPKHRMTPKLDVKYVKEHNHNLKKGMLVNKKWKAEFILQPDSSNSII